MNAAHADLHKRGAFRIGGVAVRDLVEQFGTPLFAYDAEVQRQQLRDLRAVLPAVVDVFYSVKANPNPAVIRVFVEEGAGLEIASGAEFLRARAAGCAASRIVFAGPGKSPEELELVVKGGIAEIHVETAEELAVLGAMKEEVRVSIRFNPSDTASGGAMRMGGKPTQFGFDEEQLLEVVRRIGEAPNLRLHGIHMFAGTQILNADTLVAQWRHAIGVARRVAGWIGGPLETVDLGGGLGIPYFANESPLDLNSLGGGVRRLFGEISKDPAFSGTRFLLEPGRFLVGPAGVYLCRVRSVKMSRGTRFVILDGGMNHHLAASGNLGQVLKRDYPILNATRLPTADVVPAVVVGPLCTPLDTLGRKASLPETEVGDIIAVLQSGAYGLSASPVGFLSHPTPAEVLVDNGRPGLIREAGSFETPAIALPR